VNDDCGVCGGDNSSCGGCTNPQACNYDATAIVDDGSCVINGVNLTFSLLTDNYPGETTWSLTDDAGNVIMDGGPYNSNQTTYTESACVPTGCYVLTVNDSYGDGLQYGGVVGNYTMVDGDGNVLAEMADGGNFGSQVTEKFCVEATGSDVPGCTDNTACNLASLNLVKFYDDETQVFDIASYKHALRIWTIVLEISVEMAQFPSKEIAQGSYDYRTLGLGYANLGSLLMRKGIAYDSDLGRSIAGALTAMLTGEAYKASAEMAGIVGPFPKYEENSENMLRVMNNHRKAAYDTNDYEGLSHDLIAINQELCPIDLLEAAQLSWDEAVELGTKNGYRNAQATVLAPTGTIGLLMDCDTTGVEPDFALMKFKKLAGGGYMKIANQSIGPALQALGYENNQVNEIIQYVIGSMSLDNSPYVNKQSLMDKGLSENDIEKIENALPGAFEIQHAFNVFVLGEDTLKNLGIKEEEYTSFDFNLLEKLGFSRNEIAQANLDICGTQKIEGAPHLKEEHLEVFDCANKCGKDGERFIHYMGHVRMMAAAQPFISGAISKTVNMPNEATVQDIEDCYFESAKIGVKAIATYRDGSKASQPLSASSDDGDSDESDPEVNNILEEEAMLVQ